MPSSGLPKTDSTTASPQQQQSAGCFTRIFWLVIGNCLLLGCAALIAKRPPWSFSYVDAGYWSVVALLLAARFLDIRHFHGETSNGQPATMSHLRSYAIMLCLVAGALWAAAHSIAL